MLPVKIAVVVALAEDTTAVKVSGTPDVRMAGSALIDSTEVPVETTTDTDCVAAAARLVFPAQLGARLCGPRAGLGMGRVAEVIPPDVLQSADPYACAS